MASKTSPTLKVLREIRDRLDSHDRRFESIEQRMDSMEQNMILLQTRLTTEVIAVADAVREVSALLRDRLDDRARVDDHERRLRDLERKVG